jgi:CheY-like chemotaxis protein
MPNLFGNAEHWLVRAKEAREMAEKIADPAARQAMTDIATNYDMIAKRAEAREVGVPLRQNQRPRVLVVDDDNATRYVTTKLLSRAGYDVVEARDYSGALSVLEDDSVVDVLFVDLVLPQVNGFALARMARMKNPRIKCIYTTGFDVPTSEAIGPVLRKPVADDVLLATVAKALAP